MVQGIVTGGRREKVLHYMEEVGLSPGRLDFIQTGDEVGPDVVASGTVSREDLLAQGVPPDQLLDSMEQLPEYLGL